MLEFFRKYQRFFFIVITGVVIASFSFFGTFGSFVNEEGGMDRIIGKTVDGSSISLREVQQLARFIGADREEFSQGRGSSFAGPNFANDGVIRYDFLHSGLAEALVSTYFNGLKEGFGSRLEKAKRFRPYEHFAVPSLSARAIWDRYVPKLNAELAELQKEKEISPAVFSRLSKLYQQQSYLPPELLRRILMYQHQNAVGGNFDPKLAQGDLSLFGFHSLSEWFGEDFVNLVAQFILNASVQAEQKGYRVSLEEAKADLFRNFEKSMEKLNEAQRKPDLNFHQHLRMLGFDEKSAAETWRKVLLFRRYFQDVGQSAFVDRMPFQDFSEFAQETAILQKYEWNEALRFKTFQDLLEFQVYLKSVGQAVSDPLALPAALLPIEEIETKTPEMVQAEYRVQMAELAKSQIGLRASIREIWEWELEEKNWELLKKEFSPLPKCGSREERFKALENLDPSFRAQVDAYSRNCLVDLNPSWIEEALQTAAKVERTIPIYGPDAAPFVRLPAIEKGEGLGLLLIQAAQQDREALATLKNYSDDGIVFFRFENVQKMGEKQILSFEAARKTVLTELTNKVLQKEYLKIRSKFPQKLKQASGEWKPFSEVKNEVGKIVFADLVKALDPIVKNESGQKEKGEDAYAVYRLAALSKRALEDLKKDPADPHWVQAEDPLLRQFKLERKEAKIQRNLKEDWMQEEAFVLMPNQWSPVRVAEEGQIVFFYLQERKPAEAPIFDLLSFGKEILAADAQRYLAERLLETAKQKNAIILPLQEGTLQGNQTGEQDEPL